MNMFVQCLIPFSDDRGGRIKIHRHTSALLIFPMDDVNRIVVYDCIIANLSDASRAM